MKNEHEQHKEMEDILKAELDREARAILAEIEADESLKDLTMPDEAEDELMQRIQKLEEEKAAQEKLSEKDKEALRLGREIQMQKENRIEGEKNVSAEEGGNVVAFRKRKRRTYLLVAVVAVMVMMMGMTSVGEVPLVTSLKQVFFGDAEMVKINSEREDENQIETAVEDELAIYEEIKETFKVDILWMDYKPNGTKILDYEIDDALNRATIIYQCGETIFNYRLLFNYRNQTTGYMIEDEMISERTLNVNEIPIQLQISKIEDTEEISYIAQFEYQGVYYIFKAATTFQEAEIEKILENIKIF